MPRSLFVQDGPPRRSLSLAMGCALVVTLLVGLWSPGVGLAYRPPPIRHVFVIVDENQSASTVFTAGSPAPYLSQTLVAQGAYLPNYYGIGHDSADNYIAMVSGQAPNPLTSSDCSDYVNFTAPTSLDAAGQETGEGCVYPANVPSLMSELDAAGLTWRAYEDGMGSDPTRESATCAHPAVGAHDPTQSATAQDQYVMHRDPFVYFHYVIDNPAECNANVVSLTRLPADLQRSATTPNFVFITPNACNDGHEMPCPVSGQPGGLTQVDTFLKTWVPAITASPAFQQNGLLIITFDESVGDVTACCNQAPGPYELANNLTPGLGGPGGGVVGAVLLSPAIAPGTRSTTSYNHYSLLASIEDLFGLPRVGEAVGSSAFGSDVYTRPSGVIAPASPNGGDPPGRSAPGAKGGVALSRGRLRLLVSRQLAPSGRAARIARVVKDRGYWLRFRSPEAGRVLVEWYEGRAGARLARSRRAKGRPTLIASGVATFRSAGRRRIKIRLTRAGRRRLKHAKRLRLTAKGKFTPRRGSPVSMTRRFVLRR